MSLKSCLINAGKAVDAEAVQQEYRRNIQDGLIEPDAARSAAQTYLESLLRERQTLVERIKAQGGEAPRPLFSVASSSPAPQKLLEEKLRLGPQKAKSLSAKIYNLTHGDLRKLRDEFGRRAQEGLFDGLIGMLRAEQAAGVTEAENMGYVAARLATGVSDLMTAVLRWGAPEWKIAQGGWIDYKDGTVGLLEILGDLGPHLTDWLSWMAGNRAEELMAQGRERNFDVLDIQELKNKTHGNEALFQSAKAKYNALNSAMLDFAEGAGLINPDARKDWESEWYVPFYRVEDEDEILLAPRTKRGLSHQTAGIRYLRGAEKSVNDLLENILTNWVKLADSSAKNYALKKAIDNLKGHPEYLTNETLKFRQAIIPQSEIVKKIKGDRNYVEMLADMLGMPDAGEVEVLHEIAKLDTEGYEKLWSLVAPTDPDVVRITRNGKHEYYRIHDKPLLRSITSLGFQGFNDPVTKSMRMFKRLLTAGVTASPDFMFRNFVRDAMQAWAINKDGFTFAKDSIQGLRQAFEEDEDYRSLMFGMGSFQGGYVHGTDPEASAQIIRRALEAKGLSATALDAHMKSLVTDPAHLFRVMRQGWQIYRGWGDKIENSNRLATYKAALRAGKHPIQAAFEAKDQMDYSRRGNFHALMWLTDVVPFLNARIQGLEKLGRASRENGEFSKVFARKFGQLVVFSLILAMLNDDDDRYKELEDWDKDAYWHFWIGEDHFRIPKPFEIGILGGTIPERMYHYFSGTQPSSKLKWSLMHNLMATLNFNPIPQIAVPAIEVWGNESFFYQTPIEGFGDEQKLPEARYNARTSETMRMFGEWLGVSPKKLEHLWKGYLGTIGAYALATSDMLVSTAQGAPDKPSMRPSDVIGLKSFWRGSGIAYSTQYETDLYEALDEVNKLHQTMASYRKSGLIDKSRELGLKGAEKLKYRKRLESAAEQINAIRKRMDAIYRDPQKSSEQKRTEVDALLARKRDIAKRVANQIEGSF